MKKILILGAGAMGSAFAVPCIDNGNKVVLCGTHLENNLIDKIKKGQKHPGLNSKLPKKIKIIKFNQFQETYSLNFDYVVLAVSSKGIDWACKQLIKNYKNKISIILLTKGLTIINKNIITLSKKVNLIFKKNKLPEQNITSIKGPCLASGLVNRIRTSTVIANKNIGIAKQISKTISTDYYRTEVSNDINGIEVSGAIKNIYSMLIGASMGLSAENANQQIREKYHHNTASALFRKSLDEIKEFIKLMNGKPETAYGLAGLGDLYVSVAGGRNSMMGRYLGQGKLYKNIIRKFMKNVTVEGADLALEIGPLILKKYNNKKFPILFSLIRSICFNKKLKINW